MTLICIACGCVAPRQGRERTVESSPVNLEAAGYVRTEATGVWKYGFERSAFAPDDRTGEEWWLKLSAKWWDENAKSAIAQKGIRDEGVRVRASGLLSPAGKYGRFGNHPREFVADRISEAPR